MITVKPHQTGFLCQEKNHVNRKSIPLKISITCKVLCKKDLYTKNIMLWKIMLGEVIYDLNPIIIFQSSSMGIYSSVDLFHYFCNLCDFWNYLECHCQLFRWWLFPSTKIWPRFRKMFSIPIHLKALTKQIYISLLKFKKYTQGRT